MMPVNKDEGIKLHSVEISKHSQQPDLFHTFSEYRRPCHVYLDHLIRAFEDLKECTSKLFGDSLCVSITEAEKKKSSIEEKEITGLALIDKLDDDCLMKIFSYLPLKQRFEIETVCVRWEDVSKRGWHDVRKLKFNSKSDLEYFNSTFLKKSLVRCGVYLKSLEISCECRSDMLPFIGEQCNNLTSIALKFTKKNFKHANTFSKMRKLQSITITNAEPRFLIKCLLSLPKTVRAITIIYCTFYSSYKNLPVRNNNNILDKFNVLDSLTMKGYTFQKRVIKAISEKQTITKLCLSSCEIREGLNLLTNLENLKDLDLGKVHEVDDDFLICLSRKCQKLKYLNLSHCKQLSDDGIGELKNLENLEELFINMGTYMKSRISDLPLGQLKGIKILECQNCSEVSDPGIMRLIENSQDLEGLNLKGTSISEETLRFAIREKELCEHSKILYLTADIKRMKFDVQQENCSPYHIRIVIYE